MNIEYYIDDNEMFFPEIFIRVRTEESNIIDSIKINLNGMIEIIPTDILIQYRNLLKNKIVESISTNKMSLVYSYISYLDFVTKYLEENDG